MPTDINTTMREIVNGFTAEQKEKLIADLGVTHLTFENWLEGHAKIGNSAVKNKLMHLLGVKLNYAEFREKVKDLSECCLEEENDDEGEEYKI